MRGRQIACAVELILRCQPFLESWLLKLTPITPTLSPI